VVAIRAYFPQGCLVPILLPATALRQSSCIDTTCVVEIECIIIIGSYTLNMNHANTAVALLIRPKAIRALFYLGSVIHTLRPVGRLRPWMHAALHEGMNRERQEQQTADQGYKPRGHFCGNQPATDNCKGSTDHMTHDRPQSDTERILLGRQSNSCNLAAIAPFRQASQYESLDEGWMD